VVFNLNFRVVSTAPDACTDVTAKPQI
jgi:hypothetical protein